MQQFIDKLISRLEEYFDKSGLDKGKKETMRNIVNQLAEEYKPRTNADKVRAMNDEELAEFLEQFEACSNCEYEDGVRCTLENPCVHAFASAMIFKWLQSETKEGD